MKVPSLAQKSKREKMGHILKNSYDNQHNALLGMNVNTRGDSPLAKPLIPSLCQMIRKASTRPFVFRISASEDDPRVCSSVLATSRGVVTPAATPPASPPAIICVIGEYTPEGFKSFFRCSYTVNWTAVNGTVIVNVVG